MIKTIEITFEEKSRKKGNLKYFRTTKISQNIHYSRLIIKLHIIKTLKNKSEVLKFKNFQKIKKKSVNKEFENLNEIRNKSGKRINIRKNIIMSYLRIKLIILTRNMVKTLKSEDLNKNPEKPGKPGKIRKPDKFPEKMLSYHI